MLMLAGASTLGLIAASITCYGVVAIGAAAFRAVTGFIVMSTISIAIAVTVGFLTARSSYRGMVRNYWHKRTPLSERPDMQPPVSNAEDPRSSNKTFRP